MVHRVYRLAFDIKLKFNLLFFVFQVMQMKDEFEREHERKMTEMREAARRMKDDCSHQVEMERFYRYFLTAILLCSTYM